MAQDREQKSEPEIQFIYTFSKGPQRMLDVPFTPELLASEETLKAFAKSCLNDAEKKDLVKVSTCVYFNHGPEIELPDWFWECNGKLWFE